MTSFDLVFSQFDGPACGVAENWDVMLYGVRISAGAVSSDVCNLGRKVEDCSISVIHHIYRSVTGRRS